MTEIDLIINQFILEEGKLYTLPELYQQLDEKIRSNTSTISDIGELLSTDAALSAKILKLANCPLYGFRSEITTLDRALNLIGLKEVKNLILMDAVAQNFNKNDKYTAIQMEDFWRRSVYIALLAKKLAKRIKHKEPDRLFICGIMSRLGQLVACLTRPKEVVTITHQCQNDPHENELAFESNILGYTYNEISGQLLKHWKVPEEISSPIRSLHQPFSNLSEIPDDYLTDIYVLYTATMYTHQLGIEDEHHSLDMPLTDIYLNSVPFQVNKALNIDKSAVDDILFEIEVDALEILSIVFPKSTSIF